MEMTILQFIQNLRNPALDKFMLTVFNDIVGSAGQIWLVVGFILLVIPKTRRCGLCLLLSYLVAYFIGDSILKNLIGRIRLCNVDTTVELIVKRPSSFSCPSVHSMLAFASATALYLYEKKPGIIALVFAALIGFSRLYFFVHYPSDVLLGTVLGILTGYLIYRLFNIENQKE